MLDTKEERNELLLEMDELNAKLNYLIKAITAMDYEAAVSNPAPDSTGGQEVPLIPVSDDATIT